MNEKCAQCSKCAHAFQCEGLQNNHTSLKLSENNLQHSTKKTWYWSFYIEYENTMMSRYIERVHAVK